MMSTVASNRTAFTATTAAPRPRRSQAARCMAATKPDEMAWPERAVRGAAAAVAASALLASPALATERLTFDELQSKSYLELKGTGMAHMCPTLSADAEKGLKDMAAGSYHLDRFCMEPTAFNVRVPGDSEFRKSTLMTRLTYLLSDMTGTVTVGRNGSMAISHGPEDEGLDYAAVTVKAPGSAGQGGEVPFLFSAKSLEVKGPADNMAGTISVPSYRGSSFFDTIGRGGSTGWDWQKGLPGADQDTLVRQNLKAFEPTAGDARFAVTRSDPVTGEVEGVFITHQLSSDDMGAKPEDVCDIEVQGVWYGTLERLQV